MLANERKQQFFQAEIFFTKNSIFFCKSRNTYYLCNNFAPQKVKFIQKKGENRLCELLATAHK
jgi:hypothetical protein